MRWLERCAGGKSLNRMLRESAGPALPGFPDGEFPSEEDFIETYASKPQFDPQGFWFITQRCGIVWNGMRLDQLR